MEVLEEKYHDVKNVVGNNNTQKIEGFSRTEVAKLGKEPCASTEFNAFWLFVHLQKQQRLRVPVSV